MIKCIVIDDEQPAREFDSHAFLQPADFELLASFDNALDGFNFLQKHIVDLVFLDIQMPRVSGLETDQVIKGLPEDHPYHSLPGICGGSI